MPRQARSVRGLARAAMALDSLACQRTVNSAWLREVRGSNYVHLNAADAAARGIATNDRVTVTSATASVEGVAYLTEGLRPGVVGADAAYGH